MSVDTDTPPTNRRRASRIGLATLIVVGLAVGGYWLVDRAALAARQAEVAQRGADVMPFALEETTHEFRPSADGGVQTVLADDGADGKQVDLIRSHLREEAERFRLGDFSDPAAIHGQQMPGLEVLSDRAGEIDITYTDVPEGGRITYVTDDPTLVEALHHWFAAQLRDHGHDAVGG